MRSEFDDTDDGGTEYGRAVPPGYVRCHTCGEFNGATAAKNLNWDGAAFPERPDTMMTVRCLCQGVLCGRCRTNLIHRPGSNSYEPETNTIGHWFHLAGMLPCRECHQKSHDADPPAPV